MKWHSESITIFWWIAELWISWLQKATKKSNSVARSGVSCRIVNVNTTLLSSSHHVMLSWTIQSQLTLHKNSPPFVTVAMSEKPCWSYATHHVLTQWKIHCGTKRKLTTCQETRQSTLLLVWNMLSIFLRNSNNKKHFIQIHRSLFCLSSSGTSSFHMY